MTTLNSRANAAYNALIENWNREHPDWEWMGFDHQRDAYETGWEDGYKAARQEAGPEGMGGEDGDEGMGLVAEGNQMQGEQASGALLARLEAIQASRQTNGERFAVGLCIAAVHDHFTGVRVIACEPPEDQ